MGISQLTSHLARRTSLAGTTIGSSDDTRDKDRTAHVSRVRREMLALRFGDVDLEGGLVTQRGETTKSRKTHVVPISTARLRAVLEWLRLDADGEPKADSAWVFSNDVVERLWIFHRRWQTVVLRAPTAIHLPRPLA